eukprot:1950322-Pleurochrysis_carterae.AAC.1
MSSSEGCGPARRRTSVSLGTQHRQGRSCAGAPPNSHYTQNITSVCKKSKPIRRAPFPRYGAQSFLTRQQRKWCKLCAWAHGKDCQRLAAQRAEEARRTQELMARAKRETAPTRAQLQAARPEYTLSVKREKQAQEESVLQTCEEAAKGVDGARAALRAELNAVRTQT